MTALGRLDDIALLFRDPPLGEHFQSARRVGKHGGRLEDRRLRASAVLAAYLQEAGWPDATLALVVEAQVSWSAHPTRPARHDVRYFLSSLPAATAPGVLLRLVRTHWHIEKRMHWPPYATSCWGCCTATPRPTAPPLSGRVPGRPLFKCSACLVFPPHKL